ncbi:sulfatase-like hydrolase/transferase [Fulvivirgaceae bacterium BMA10]|uniref:Sulfatase-like hydrolase/transferase n=1 Tax=Splendidivirga corallicola TaxID=3051826 RepID=A0ABT8KUW7_9BACT|nr:sulfatase-like hydrolase/transferase [Fulvivirgaceae bacterium BMA10]
MRSIGISMIALLLITCTSREVEDRRPNVVLMLIDNQSYFELSRNGHQIVQTPRIDRLAKEAVNFTDFHAPPFCSPSRTALLTGRYALRAGVHNTIGGVSILHKDETTLADLLKDAGYNTSIFGKWHLGMTYPYAPRFRGFDEVFIHGGGGVSQLEDYYGNSHIDATYEHNGQYIKSKGFSTDVLFDQAIDYIDNKQKQEAPFFCFISTPAVHFPTNRHPETTKRLLERGTEDSEYLALYSMIENVDDNVGKLLDYLESSGLKENTLVILASDQGVNDRGAVEHRSGEFQNRGLGYDEKHQVYCMIQYPELTDKNPGDVNNLTGMVDVMPTILEICQVKQPDNLDGQSLKPLLAGGNGWNNERKLIVQCPRSRVREKWKNTAVKYKKWRLVDGKELYNIKEDYGQKIDIVQRHPDIVRALTETYESFWNSLSPARQLISPHILGASEAPEVRLNGMDWYVGDAPWTQGALDKKTSQGRWKVHVARDGQYRFELRRYPREAPRAIEANTATVDIGDVKKEVQIDTQAHEAMIALDLKKGTYDLKTTFKQIDDQVSWGAYYVHVSYLNTEHSH